MKESQSRVCGIRDLSMTQAKVTRQLSYAFMNRQRKQIVNI